MIVILEDKEKMALQYTMTRGWLYGIAAYYILIILVSIPAIIRIVTNFDGIAHNKIFLYASIISIASSAMLSSVSYLRKIYKACLERRIVASKNGERIEQFGNLLYFFLRPLFAVVFSITAIIALLSGVFIVTTVDIVLNERFLYLCAVISSIIGFSTGRVLDAFERISRVSVSKFSGK